MRLEFPRPAPAPRPRRDRRTLGDKLHDIGTRSPKHIEAFDALADFVLAQLNARDEEREA
jgi:hypothetical protein